MMNTNGNVKQAGRDMGLDGRGAFCIREVGLGFINVEIVLEALGFDEVTIGFDEVTER